jgi:hypothetical protein
MARVFWEVAHMTSRFARRLGLTLGLALLALACATATAFADEHSGRGRDGGGRGRDRDRDDVREVRVVVPDAPALNVVYQPRAAAPQCATPDPSLATVDSIFNQFMANGGLSLTQAALIGNALYLSADEVQELAFDQLIGITQCAGVSLDTLASILSGA